LIINWRDIMNPLAGGSEIYFHEMAKKWVRKGHEVTILCGGWKGCLEKEHVDGIDIIRCGKGYSLYLLAPLKYLSLKKKFDVIIDVENGIPFFTPLFSRTKKFLHIHHVHKDVWFKELEDKGLIGKLMALVGYTLESYVMPLVYRKTKVITISLSSSNEIETELGLDTVGIVKPAYSIDKVPQNKKTFFPSILFLNRIKKYKGADVLVKAFKIVRQDITDAKLYIAGSGDYLDEIKKLANNDPNIIFLGRISEEEKYELMQNSWVFVNPSFKEGWGIVNIEANHFGLPVIGSDVCGIRDSILDGTTGLLFEQGNYKDLAETIKTFLNNEELRVYLSENAKDWADSFNWTTTAKEYLDILIAKPNKSINSRSKFKYLEDEVNETRYLGYMKNGIKK